MKFSLVNVTESSGPLVSGNWIQDHIGTLASAREIAGATEVANDGKTDVAVVAAVASACAILSYWSNLTRLDMESYPDVAQPSRQCGPFRPRQVDAI